MHLLSTSTYNVEIDVESPLAHPSYMLVTRKYCLHTKPDHNKVECLVVGIDELL